MLVAALGIGGIGWYYSGEILDVERPGAAQRTTEVLAVGRGSITLAADEESLQHGTYGLDGEDGYGRTGDFEQPQMDTVDRDRFTVIDGTVQVGDLVDVDGYAYPQDPAIAFDFPVAEVALASPLGEAPAWFAAGSDPERWAVMVHGRAARRNECFRMLAILHDQGLNSLCPTYRNDEDAPADPDNIYRQGAEEWRDIEPSVQYALDHGATELVLVGFSMGGQITANLLRESTLASEVDAVIWDAPLLDWGPVIAAGAEDRGVPGWLVPIGMQASEWRAGVDYDDLNQIVHADEFDVPILLFHGTADDTVPIWVAERFAEARPDIVTYVPFPEAGHVRSWNAFPSRYEQAVGAFLASSLVD